MFNQHSILATMHPGKAAFGYKMVETSKALLFFQNILHVGAQKILSLLTHVKMGKGNWDRAHLFKGSQTVGTKS